MGATCLEACEGFWEGLADLSQGQWLSCCFNPCAGCSAPPALLLFLMQEGDERVAEAERARQRAEQARRDLEANSGKPATDSLFISMQMLRRHATAGCGLASGQQDTCCLANVLNGECGWPQMASPPSAGPRPNSLSPTLPTPPDSPSGTAWDG